MFNLSNISALLYIPAIDMRKQIDGLVILVAQVLREDPQANKLFVFRNKRGDKLKLHIPLKVVANSSSKLSSNPV